MVGLAAIVLLLNGCRAAYTADLSKWTKECNRLKQEFKQKNQAHPEGVKDVLHGPALPARILHAVSNMHAVPLQRGLQPDDSSCINKVPVFDVGFLKYTLSS